MKFRIIYLFILSMVIAFQSCQDGTDLKQNKIKQPEVKGKPAAAMVSDFFLSLSDVHINPNGGNITYGSDTGQPLWLEAKRKIDAVILDKKPAFMVYLGDLPAHFTSDSLGRIAAVNQMLNNLRSIDTDIPIFYLPGNNDSPGGDYHSFTKKANNRNYTPFSGQNKPNNPWPILNVDSTSNTVTNVDFNTEFGFYSAQLNLAGGPIKIIALNTVIFCRKGGEHYISDDGYSQQLAAQKQFAWFQKTMDGLASTEKVMIMMHIPPGMDGYPKHDNGAPYYVHMWDENLKITTTVSSTPVVVQTAFLDKIGKHQPQIKAILTSHTHLDGLRRLHDSNQNVVGVSFSTPGITVNHHNNPGFKIFKYTRSNFELTDYITYYATPNSLKTNFKFHPDSLFSFRQMYNVPSSTSSLTSIVKGKSDTQLIASMKKTMYLKSGMAGSFNFTVSLDARAN